MLINHVVAITETILSEDVNLVSRLVRDGRQFEKWLQIEVYKHSIRHSPAVDLSLEQAYPGGGQRCDLYGHETDNRQSWIEIATCATNYGQPGKPITQQIAKIIGEVTQRLMRAPAGAEKHVFCWRIPCQGTAFCHGSGTIT